jgi:hypothetical protein
MSQGKTGMVKTIKEQKALLDKQEKQLNNNRNELSEKNKTIETKEASLKELTHNLFLSEEKNKSLEADVTGFELSLTDREDENKILLSGLNKTKVICYILTATTLIFLAAFLIEVFK